MSFKLCLILLDIQFLPVISKQSKCVLTGSKTVLKTENARKKLNDFIVLNRYNGRNIRKNFNEQCLMLYFEM